MTSAMLGNLYLGAAHTTLKTKIPPLIFHTSKMAKTELSDDLFRALRAGQRSLDVASKPNQIEPWRTPAIHAALARAAKECSLKREDLFIHKRFGPVEAKNDIGKTLSERIRVFIDDSLHNQFYRATDGASLQAHLDLVVLLWPKHVARKDHPDYYYRMEWFRSAWAVLETYVPSKIRHLGMARVPTPMLEDVYKAVDIKPCTIDSGFPLWHEGSFSERQNFCLKHRLVLVGSPLREWWTMPGSNNVTEQVQYHTKFLESLCFRFGLPEAEIIGCLAAGLKNTAIFSRVPMPQVMSGLNELQTWAQDNPQQWQSLVEEFQYLIRLPRAQ